DSGTAGANRRTDTIGEERARGGLVSVKNEATGRKKPKRFPFGLLGGNGKGTDSRKSSSKSERGENGVKSGKTDNGSGSGKTTGRKTASAGDRNTERGTAERSSGSRAASNAERRSSAVAKQTETPQKYSIDVELGKPVKKDSE
ncbi:MAG: hypothetical protein J6Y20_06140, partial [Lachnospiraceae bacterium]|nr:hypothetical protein [Lachnospiraceae bacterium]